MKSSAIQPSGVFSRLGQRVRAHVSRGAVNLSRRQFLHLAAAAATLPSMARLARAKAYPSRPITMVVAFAAGGSGDTIMRIVADHMRSTLGQTIVIENVGGAAGSVGVGRVARA